jgi:hypothetical protein
MGNVLRLGFTLMLLVIIMVVGSLVLWLGVPLGWLYVGSLVQAETRSIGAALAAAFVGAAVSIMALAWFLGRLNQVAQDMRRARGHEPGNPLEKVLVVTAVIAVAGFSFWFFILAGPGPTIAPH